MPTVKQMVQALHQELVDTGDVQYTRWPQIAAGSALTASGNTTGAYKYRAAGATQVQVVTAAQNANGLFVRGAGLDTLSAASIFVLWIGRGTIAAAVRAHEIQFARVQVSAVGTYGLATSFFPPILVRAGTGIALDLASSNVGADDTAQGHIVTRPPISPI